MDKKFKNKVIITAALVGMKTLKSQNEAVPYTIEEMATEAEKAYNAGAAAVHIHCRTDDGEVTWEPERYKKTFDAIKAKCPDIVINITTGNGSNTWEGKFAPLERAKPEMCSLNCQSINFCGGDFREHKVLSEFTYENTFEMMQELGKRTRALGIKPELELFSENGLHNIVFLQNNDLLEEPIHAQYVFGVLGGIPYSVENLAHFRNITPKHWTWGVGCVAKIGFSANLTSVANGGHMRVGLEDNIRMPDNRLAKGSWEQVEWAVGAVKLLGKEVATSDDMRAMLSLRPKE